MSEEQAKNICKIGQGEKCCRYLGCGAKGFECLKNSGLKPMIDSRVKNGTMHAQGDNCEGWEEKT